MYSNTGWSACTSAVVVAVLLTIAVNPAASAQGTISMAWLKDGFSAVQPALSGDGGIIAASGNKLVRLDKEGDTVWEWSPGAAAISAIAGDGSGGGWASSGKRIYRISQNGKLLWTYGWEEEITSLEPVQDGGIAATVEKGAILVDRLGKFRWLYDPATGCDT
ncbi:MAG: hypothetical protein KBB09_00225 [Firmicutes bacterium]|nr:hypothetical protein [Bacillota bacterium]